MLVYSYDGQTGRFLSAEMADADPMEAGNWLIPANATEIKPPDTDGRLWPFWTGTGWDMRDVLAAERELYVRRLRDEQLAASDWTQLPDAPLEKNARDAWRNYRKALRDLSKNPAWPFVELPAKPDA